MHVKIYLYLSAMNLRYTQELQLGSRVSLDRLFDVLIIKRDVFKMQMLP